MRCAVANCCNENKGKASELSFFSFPTDAKLLRKWVEFCRRDKEFNAKTSAICMQHFKIEDIENNMKYELGFTTRRYLKQGAVPTIYKEDSVRIEKNQREEYKKIVDDLLREYEEDTISTVYSLENKYNEAASTSFKQCILNSTLPEVNTGKVGLINEALFDHEEITKHNSIFVGDTDNAVSPFPISIDIKIEEDTTSECITSKSIQTDEGAKDRINCGFVNVSKSGPNKYFNLRCFYCDAEYPISFWSEFSDHIIYNHGDLEKVYVKKENLASNPIEHNNSIDLMVSSIGAKEELPSINFINVDDIGSIPTKHCTTKEIGHTSEATEILSENSCTLDTAEQYLYAEHYIPNIEHNYSQNDFSESTNTKSVNDTEALDEIRFDKTPRNIVNDFLDHLKGFTSLWYNRKIDCEKYDNELLKLMNIMKLKWNLNLRMNQIRNDLENIKTWFSSIIASKQKSEENNVQHIFHEYYEKCAEFLPFGNDSKHDFVCDLCNRKYVNDIQLQVHKYRKHKVGQPPYSCNKCSKRFVFIDTLINHLSKHLTMPPKKKEKKQTTKKKEEPPLSPSKPAFECFECNKNFTCAREYKLHLDIHPQGDRPYACEECGKRYTSRIIRNKHLERHKSPGYQCEFCEIKLASTYSLKAHMDAHKGIYEYVCEWCGQKCVNRKYWREHIQFAHLGYGVCKICNREYKKRTILQKHLKNLHRPTFGTVEELSKPRRRSIKGHKKGCSNSLKGRINLKLRKYEYVIDPVTHVRRLKCPKCDKSFIQHKNVREHCLKIHNYDVRNLPRILIQRPQRPPRQTLFKNYYWKRMRNINKTVIDTNAEKETATAINAITKFENPDNSNDPVSNVCLTTIMNAPSPIRDDIVFEVNEIQDDKNATGISFEQLVSEINKNYNFSLQSPSNLSGMNGPTTEQL